MRVEMEPRPADQIADWNVAHKDDPVMGAINCSPLKIDLCEVPKVVSKKRPLLFNGKEKVPLIRQTSMRITRVPSVENIVPFAVKLNGEPDINIFVGVEPDSESGHALAARICCRARSWRSMSASMSVRF
jgi:hypothetical protein